MILYSVPSNKNFMSFKNANAFASPLSIILLFLSCLIVLYGCGTSRSAAKEELKNYRSIFFPMVRHLQAHVCLGMPETDFLEAIPSTVHLDSGILVKREKSRGGRYRISSGGVWIDAPFHNGKLGVLQGYEVPYSSSQFLFRFPRMLGMTLQPLECKVVDGKYRAISFYENPYVLQFFQYPSAASTQAFSLSAIPRGNDYDELYINLPPGFFPDQKVIGLIKERAIFSFVDYGNSSLLRVILNHHEEGLNEREMLERYVTVFEEPDISWSNTRGLFLLVGRAGAKFYRPPETKLTDYFLILSADRFAVEKKYE